MKGFILPIWGRGDRLVALAMLDWRHARYALRNRFVIPSETKFVILNVVCEVKNPGSGPVRCAQGDKGEVIEERG